MDRIMERKGYEKLPSKLQSNNGIDGIYVKRGSQIVLIMGSLNLENLLCDKLLLWENRCQTNG